MQSCETQILAYYGNHLPEALGLIKMSAFIQNCMQNKNEVNIQDFSISCQINNQIIITIIIKGTTIFLGETKIMIIIKIN